MEASTAGAEPPRTRPAARATASPAGGVAAYLAELIGTFILVLAILMAVIVNSGDGIGVTDYVTIGLVHALALGVLVYAVGGASGAHLNPAVTAALALGRKIRPSDAAIYVVVQIIGGILAALLLKLLFKDEGNAVNYGAPAIAEAPPPPPAQPGLPPVADAGTGWLDGKPLGGLVVEALGAFILMWAIMAVAVNPRGERSVAGLVIGGGLGLAVLIFAPVTGASFNPARALGPMLASGEWGDGWVFIVAPVIGTILAYVSYTAIVLTPQARTGERPIDILD